jgi:DNA-binding XRE family transcriptional regulator
VPSNNVQRYRESLMLSKAELARKAGLSTLTIDRVEAGRACRLDTKRKILLALGMKISEKSQVFGTAPMGSAAAQTQAARAGNSVDRPSAAGAQSNARDGRSQANGG